jgi:hypothetical protein
MNDLKRISETLPPLENVDHYEHLEKAYQRGGWLEVDAYIDMVTNLAYLRDTKSAKVIQSTNNKKGLLTRLKNALK